MKSAQQEIFNTELLQDRNIKTLYQNHMNRELEVDTGFSSEKIYNYLIINYYLLNYYHLLKIQNKKSEK